MFKYPVSLSQFEQWWALKQRRGQGTTVHSPVVRLCLSLLTLHSEENRVKSTLCVSDKQLDIKSHSSLYWCFDYITPLKAQGGKIPPPPAPPPHTHTNTPGLEQTARQWAEMNCSTDLSLADKTQGGPHKNCRFPNQSLPKGMLRTWTWWYVFTGPVANPHHTSFMSLGRKL